MAIVPQNHERSTRFSASRRKHGIAKRFDEGIIHRHPKTTYMITNKRVLAIDRINNSVTVSLPIMETDLVVMNRHTTSVRTGAAYGREVRGFNSLAPSRTIGTLVFTFDGAERIVLNDLEDPQGMKNLFTTIKKEALGGR